MGIPPVRLQDEIPESVLQQVHEVLTSGMWIDGKNVKALEEEFAGYTGTKFCRAVSNGTAALLCALYAINLQPGDEVIIPSFSFIATANVVGHFKAKPVFIDIDETYNINPDLISEKLTPKTKAIMPVHLFGLPADMDAIMQVAKENNLKVIEDACQAHGAEYKNKKTGNLGDLAAFSLYPTKNMYCGGEGGLVTTNDADLFEKIQLFANHGRSARYAHMAEGYNYRMQETNAVIARYSLSKLDEFNAVRRQWAKKYNEALSQSNKIEAPREPAGCKHVYHQYTVRSPLRDKLQEILKSHEIGHGVFYGIPIHKQKFYLDQGYDATLPVTERTSDMVLSLPIHHNLIDAEIQSVIEAITSIL